MSRIAPAVIHDLDRSTQATLEVVKAKAGMIPNLHRTLAKAPAALNGYLALGESLAHGALDARQREIVALTTAQANSCRYCLSAHSLLGKGAGLSVSQIAAARHGAGADAKDNAIAALTLELIDKRGSVSNGAIADAHAAGLDDAQVIEIIVNVALNTLTNYLNNAAQTVIDFPAVDVSMAA